MSTTIRITIGCKAGSQYCEGCSCYQQLDINRYCQLFSTPWQTQGMEKPIDSTMLEWDNVERKYLRHQSCLEAEEDVMAAWEERRKRK